MGLKHKIRILAFQKIYSIDLNKNARDDIFDIFTIENEDLNGNETFKWLYSSLVNGTFDNLEYIDSIISKISFNWTLDRMDKVDLAILRMSIYCLRFQKTSLPKRTIIDEAILIAKEYSNQKSYKFINGILNALSKEMED